MALKYFIAFLFIASYHSTARAAYCWQEYFGDIPSNAFIAGKSIDGKNVYVGQAYVKNSGLVVVEINPGVKEVFAPIGGLHKIDKYTKILCGPQDNFYWMPTNYSYLHLQTNENHAVIGGQEDAYGYMSIGRINLSGATKIGKVNSFSPGTAYFYYNNNSKEDKCGTYEVLMYKNKTDIDVYLY